METAIARTLRDAPRRSWLALVAATAVLVVDFVTCRWFPGYAWQRYVLAGMGALLLLFLCQWDPTSLGLVLRPRHGYGYWAKTGLAIGGFVIGFCTLVFVAAHAAGYSPPVTTVSPDRAASFALSGCVEAPLVEEVLYRLVLCVPLVALAGPKCAIVVGGILFAALHFVYGNPGPDNVIAGFFFCWVYVKSGSLIVPILFHSVGNGFVLAAQLGNWYAMQ